MAFGHPRPTIKSVAWCPAALRPTHARIMPGLTNTELVEKRPQKLSAETLEQALQPDDVAATILHVMGLPPRVTMPEILMIPSLA